MTHFFALLLRIPRRTAAAAIAAALLSLGIWPAMADLVDAYFPPGIIGPDAKLGITVNSRERPATDPLGVRVGAFTIRPQIGLASGYDSNPLFNRRAKGSPVIQTTGGVAVTSNSATEPLSGLFTVEDNRFTAVNRQSTTNWTASLGKVIAFGADKMTLTAAHLALHQTGRDLNTANLDRPGAYQINNIRLSYRADRGPFNVLPQVQYTGYRYDDVSISGVRSSQGYRNRDVLEGQLTVTYNYALLRDIAVVLRGASIQYEQGRPGIPPLGATRPDATSVSALAGIDHASSAVWRYRLLAGVQARQSASPAVKSRVAPIVEANLIFMPSGLTTIGLTAARAVQDAAGEFAAAYTYTEARLAVDHELTRDILLHGHLGVQRAEYEQGGAAETIANAATSVTWLANRNMRVIGSYNFTTKHSPTGGAISESVAMIRLQLGL